MANYLDKSGLLRVLRGVKNQIERKVGELETTKGRPNGIASLDGKGFVPLAQLGNLDLNFFEAVQELPTKDIKKHIYLIKNTKEGEQDTYDEYLYTGDIYGEYDASKWEKLGDFVPMFDLKEYAKKGEVVSSMKFSQAEGCRVIYTLADGNTEEAVIPLASAKYEYLFPIEPDITTRSKPAGRWVYRDGVMSGGDKYKLDQIDTTALSQSITAANTAAGNTNEAIRKCEVATAGAEKVNANLTDDNVVEITDRKGTTKSVSLDEAVKVGNDVTRIKQTLGAYSDREDVVLTPNETNKAISSDGVKVAKQGWAIAEFTAEKGNEYLFKPNVIDGSVCVFAEYITSIETRGIDYTYTYNEDGTIATATATYLGNTHTYTYEWTVEAGVNTPTIKEGDTVINNLPMTYETKVGTYSPLVKLNEDAELPVDGYCRYMSHFKGNSSIKIVVSYKVGTADLTMKVLRDGVLASISTQLGNLSQKEDETRKKIEEYHGSYVDLVFYDVWDKLVVDGKTITVIKGQRMRLYPTKSFSLGKQYSRDFCPLAFADMSHLDTSHFATFAYMFQNCKNADIIGLENLDTGSVTNMSSMFSGCSSLTTININGWNTGSVTNMSSMFSGCSSLTTMNINGWNTGSVTNMSSMFSGCSSLTTMNIASFSAKKLKTGNSVISGIGMMFLDCGSLKTLDMGGDDWCFDSMVENTNNFYRWLEGRNVSSLTLGKNWFKAEFMPINFGHLSTWNKESVRLSLVTNSYDRKANGLTDKTITLHANVKKLLSEDDIATMTAKGYIIA